MTAKKILLTGATGSVGKEVLRQFKEAGLLSNLSILARDTKKNHRLLKPYHDKATVFFGHIYDADVLKRACENQDVVIHLAALIPPGAEENLKLNERINFEGTKKLIKAMEEIAPNAFLLFSSSVAVYGDRINTPNIKTTDTLSTDPHDPYALAKIRAERLIQESQLDWSIFRLTAIMGDSSQKPQGLMFEMPLESNMEIATVRDTARAFILAVEKRKELKHRIYNLSGGSQCRTTYAEYLNKAFQYTGIGKVKFPKNAFAQKHFHCGNYDDSDLLEDVLHFRQDDLKSHWDRFEASVPGWQRMLTIPFGGLIQKVLLVYSKPYNALKKGDQKEIDIYFNKA